ncbi:MAG: hypothetical protein J3K34DRAFT_527755 [Monoraphidium minutum]|nr:MAG: hypothetical protein J3K34DRAFT_527755 [Monoraphidium minutum]
MAEELGEGVKSYDELQTDLNGYEEQQRQVEQLLLLEPENQELSEMYDSLSEVIQLTKDLLSDAKQQHAAGGAPGPSAAAAADAPAPAAADAAADAAAAGGAALGASQVVTPAALNAPGVLPENVADQIRRAQQRSALTGQAPAGWAVGGECLAYYAADGQWYPGVVESVSEDGKFVVLYDGYGTREELVPGSVRPRVEEVSEEVYKGVAAPKRKRVEDEPIVTEIPKWLEIKPEDDEKTVARKKKLLKSYKSKIRFSNLDIKSKEKQGSWQSFLKGKGGKGKTGFMTGKKKGSMFSVPEGGKVGVVGSGRGMTDYKKAGRHEFSVDS